MIGCGQVDDPEFSMRDTVTDIKNAAIWMLPDGWDEDNAGRGRGAYGIWYARFCSFIREAWELILFLQAIEWRNRRRCFLHCFSVEMF